MQDVYDANTNQALLLTNIFYFLYIPGSFLSAFLLNRFGFRDTTFFGAVLMFCCAVVRAVSGFGPSYAGQVSVE